ncbi:universal stress protein [Haloarcula marina]|uniref:universal stress protein n=1 Tax=Haloarcula marina TaxID=2961574 RepID=UPI0020B8978D|nr:universal stress protein [Halomicroarcula marina]
MESILLATDGSEYARAAAKHAVELSAAEDLPLYVISVVDERRFNEPALSSTELATIFAEDHATMTIADVRELADGTGVNIEGDTRHGIPHEVILDYAREVGAKTIVLGEHGEHEEHFSGVGRKVAEAADCECVVVEGPQKA